MTDLEPRSDRPVDQSDPGTPVFAEVVSAKTYSERPIIAPWLRDPVQRRDTVESFLRRQWHRIAGHTTHLHIYVGNLIKYSPRGWYRATRWVIDTWFDGDSRPLRNEAIAKKDSETFLKLRNDQLKRVRKRTPLFLGLGVIFAATVTAVVLGPPVVQIAAVTLLVFTLGGIGAPADKPIARAMVAVSKAPKLTSSALIDALRSLRIKGMDDKAPIGFPDEIMRDGPGYRANVDLPPGVTPQMVMEKRLELASGLTRPAGCVWPRPAPKVHGRRLVVWVGEQDMAQRDKVPGPLVRVPRLDAFEPLPFGRDQRERIVAIRMMETNMLIGAMPGMGKTFAMRLMLLGMGLDPTCEVDSFELKGSGDLSCAEKFAHRYAKGAGDDTMEACLAAMRDLAADIDRRADQIAQIAKADRDLCPENKVTRELADIRRYGLHPRAFFLDECQDLFGHEDKTIAKEAERLALRIIKKGRAFGVMLFLATQRPDAQSLPKAISAQAGIRFCLKVMDADGNNAVLGNGMYAAGYRATELSDGDPDDPEDKGDVGIGLLRDMIGLPRIIRTDYIDNPTAERIADRARALREKAGTLGGYAVGDEPKRGEQRDVLRDLHTVFVECRVERIWSENGSVNALNELADRWYEYYGEWSAQRLAQELRRASNGAIEEAKQLKIAGENKNGYRLEQIQAALQAREIAA